MRNNKVFDWLAFLVMWMGLLLAGPATAEEATYIGEKACISCHGQENRHFSETLHAKVFRLNPRNDQERRVCEACHGPGSLHAKNTKDKTLLVGFTKNWGTPVEKINAQCLACHQGGNRLHWPGSIHAGNQVACSDCHNPMEKVSPNSLEARHTINDTCQQCHRQQRAEFNKRSHMPLPEGKMTCVDCHNPHGSPNRPLLKAENANNLCYTCHAEKRGPFLWEHAPVRESCLNCHNPHGSNHDKLLVAARPFLCQQCHSPSVGHPGNFWNNSNTAASVTAEFTTSIPGLFQNATPPANSTQSQRIIGRSCQNCHSQIHGSNHPAGARWQR
jgi:DmsE family decaheme c-type cytochrome